MSVIEFNSLEFLILKHGPKFNIYIFFFFNYKFKNSYNFFRKNCVNWPVFQYVVH